MFRGPFFPDTVYVLFYIAHDCVEFLNSVNADDFPSSFIGLRQLYSAQVIEQSQQLYRITERRLDFTSSFLIRLLGNSILNFVIDGLKFLIVDFMENDSKYTLSTTM